MRMSFKKRALFLALMLVVVYVSVEGLAFAAYWAYRGESFSFADVRARQHSVASAGLGDGDGGAVAVTSRITLHPYLGYVYDPTGAIGSYDVNRHGFRGVEGPILEREPQTVNVAVFGGSVAQMFYDHGRDEFVRSLREHPAFADQRIRVVGFATGGYKQPQQLLALSYMLGLGAEFDLVINLDGFNEVALAEQQSVHAGVNPFFPSRWKQLASNSTSPATMRRIGAVAAARMQRSGAAAWLVDTPLGYSVFANLIWEFTDERLRRAVAAAEHALAIGEGRTQPFSISGPPAEFADRDALYDALVDVWFDCSVQMERLCRANGARYVHFLQPNQYVDGSKPLSDEERRTAFDESSVYTEPVRLGYPRLRARAAELVASGVAFHDLTEAFVDVEETLYIDSCCHFNVVGNRILARAMAAAISADAPVSDARAREPVTGLVVEPGECVLGVPLSTAKLTVRAMLEGGAERDVTYAATTFSSSDPAVATVSEFGVVRALRAGIVEVTATHRGTEARSRVRVEFPEVVAFGRGVMHAGAPRLAATVDDGHMRFEMTNLESGAVGTLFLAFAPLQMQFCDALLFVSLDNALQVPVRAKGRRAVFDTPLPESIRGHTTYWQGAFLDRRGRCGVWTTDAVALTPR